MRLLLFNSIERFGEVIWLQCVSGGLLHVCQFCDRIHAFTSPSSATLVGLPTNAQIIILAKLEPVDLLKLGTTCKTLSG